MNFNKVFCMVCLPICFLTSCNNKQENKITKDIYSSSNITVNSMDINSCCSSITDNTISETDSCLSDNNNSTVISYNVYQQGVTGNQQDEFSIVMVENSISTKMRYELFTKDIPSTAEFQSFYHNYINIWQDELLFSIDNLKKYLSDGEAIKFDTAQADWENSLQSNREFDQSFIYDNELPLGSQYVSSTQIYLINQYKERVFHIKYMTYLKESYSKDKVTKSNQLWCKFHEFN